MWRFDQQSGRARLLLLAALCLVTTLLFFARQLRSEARQSPANESLPAVSAQENSGPSLRGQTQEQASAKSAGCISCHVGTDEPTMHPTKTVFLGCTDCHGGNSTVQIAQGIAATSPEYKSAKEKAHVQPREAFFKGTSTVPVRAFTEWLKESYEYVKFVNPGDLRVAPETCGSSGCHATETRAVSTSMMTHAGMLWGAALYNNGGYPTKNTRFGESYNRDGQPQTIITYPPPLPEETRTKGVIPELDPLYRWEISQPGNVLRMFERGGRKKSELGNPNREEDPGKPDDQLSDRGFGTELRTDPVFLGLQKTRLLDPVMSLPGTNDHPGDYRGSGCTACHVVYANDDDAAHSAGYAKFGHSGLSASSDPTISKTESGHPIKHTFTKSIPSSQCMICHIHPGTNMVTTYFGLTWWDNEIDGDKMYPPTQRNPTEEDRYEAFVRNPEGAAARGLWSNEKFLEAVGSPEFNAKLKTTNLRTSTVTAGSFAPFSITIAKAIGSIKTATPFSSTIPTASAKPSISLTSIWKKACSATIAISPRMITATEKFMANPAPRWKSIASIATAPFVAKPRCSPPVPPLPNRNAPANLAAATSRLFALPGATAASNGAAINQFSAPCPMNTRNGKWCKPRTASLPATSTSAPNPSAQK